MISDHTVIMILMAAVIFLLFTVMHISNNLYWLTVNHRNALNSHGATLAFILDTTESITNFVYNHGTEKEKDNLMGIIKAYEKRFSKSHV